MGLTYLFSLFYEESNKQSQLSELAKREAELVNEFS